MPVIAKPKSIAKRKAKLVSTKKFIENKTDEYTRKYPDSNYPDRIDLVYRLGLDGKTHQKEVMNF